MQLVIARGSHYAVDVSLKDLKHEVEELPPQDQFELAAYLQHLREKSDPAYHSKLKQANVRLGSGKGVTLEELRKVVKAMDAQGL